MAGRVPARLAASSGPHPKAVPGWPNPQDLEGEMLETLVEFADVARGNQWITLAIAIAFIVAMSLLWAAGERCSERKRQLRERLRDDDEERAPEG